MCCHLTCSPKRRRAGKIGRKKAKKGDRSNGPETAVIKPELVSLFCALILSRFIICVAVFAGKIESQVQEGKARGQTGQEHEETRTDGRRKRTIAHPR